MVREGIVLGHHISRKGIEAYRAKVEIIEKLPPLTLVKGVRSFLGHADFFRRFIQDFSKISKPLSNLLMQRVPFDFDDSCMMAIFFDMVEESIEIFMDDFFVIGSSFDECLENVGLILKRCMETNLVLNWEKCHFMVREGIVLGHHISGKGIEVDRAKVEIIEKLPPPTSVKGVRSFLGHVGFFRRFI